MTAAEPIVYVVDDDASIREALGSLVRSLGMRVETFASAGDFVRHERDDVPSCVVLDVLLPDATGLELQAALVESGRPIPIVFITGHGTIPMGVKAMKEGAIEFLTKPFDEEELILAIREALQRDEEDRRKREQLLELRKRWERLTPREREVLALVVTGRLNKQIARELGAAEQTIKVHRGRIMRKLEAKSVADLVRFVEAIAEERWAEASGTSQLVEEDPAGPEPGSGPSRSVIRR